MLTSKLIIKKSKTNTSSTANFKHFIRDPKRFRLYLDDTQLPYVREPWQIEYALQKLSLLDVSLPLRETVDVRARGASKTFDTMELALFLSLIGYIGIWFSAGRDQLEQPKIYLKYIIDRNPLLQGSTSEILKQTVTFSNGGMLKLRNLTELNARSSRADFIVYDEEAQADKAAYNAAVSILAGSDLGLVFHISTPAKATIFEENHDRIKLREEKYNRKFIFTRAWNQVGFLKKKSEWYEEQKRIQPSWYFRQEHECKFELPSGAVFKNVDYSPYGFVLEEQQLCSGIDWNPVAGHWLVGVKWTPDMKHVYVMEAHDLGNGYTHEMTSIQYDIIRNYYMRGNTLVVEDGGINEAYVKWLKEKDAENTWRVERNLYYEEWDGAGVNKLQAASYITQNGICIHVDKTRFEVLAKMIEDCHWDVEATEPKIAKDKADSPHALDAFLHAISEKNRRDNVIELGRFY